LIGFSRSGNAGAGTVAKDKLGNDIKVDEWLKTHGPNDRTLAQGLKVRHPSIHHLRACSVTRKSSE
jgi:hypothetical protein